MQISKYNPCFHRQPFSVKFSFPLFFQTPPALCGWTSPRRWWRAARWCCTARWTVILLPGSPGCSETRSFCGTQRPTSPSPWTTWHPHRREYTPALGTMAMAAWTLHCTWLSSVSLRDSMFQNEYCRYCMLLVWLKMRVDNTDPELQTQEEAEW